MLPPPTAAKEREALGNAIKAYHAAGITSVIEPGLEPFVPRVTLTLPALADDDAPASGFTSFMGAGHKYDRAIPEQPVNGTDNVPGTEVTWDTALINALERITERLEQKADKADVARLERKVDMNERDRTGEISAPLR